MAASRLIDLAMTTIHAKGEVTHGIQSTQPELRQGARLHPGGAQVPAQAVRRPEGGQVRRLRAAAAQGQEHRPDLREDLDPHALRVRGGGLRPGRPRHLPGPVRLADRPQGIDERHRPGAGAHVRRHRVPRLRSGVGGNPGPVRRRAGVERPDRRVPSHADAGRHPDHDRAQRQALRARSPTATWATPASTWATR